MTPTEKILLAEMRYIASISTGQVKRVAEVALSTVSAMKAQQVSVPDKREPLSEEQMERIRIELCNHRAVSKSVMSAVARAVEAHHKIPPQGDKP